MYLRIFGLAVLALSGGIGAYSISDITYKDVIAAQYLTQPVEGVALHAGDIVALPSQGGIVGLCKAGFEAENRTEQREVYYNRAMRRVVTAARWAEGAGLLEQGKADAILERQSVPFVGAHSSLEDDATGTLAMSCKCAMARYLAAGERICRVSASLIETGAARLHDDGTLTPASSAHSLAIRLAPDVISLSPDDYATCGLEYTVSARAVAEESCTMEAPLPVDVRLRRFFKLIDSEPLQAIPAVQALN